MTLHVDGAEQSVLFLPPAANVSADRTDAVRASLQSRGARSAQPQPVRGQTAWLWAVLGVRFQHLPVC